MEIGTSKVTGDEALVSLSNQEGPGADLVRAFLQRPESDDLSWLESWFQTRIEHRFSGTLTESEAKLEFDPPSVQTEAVPLSHSIKLKSVQPFYFRGFRDNSSAIDMLGEFIVIEGRNSSGKTSLAEALEWLFTGSLSRRENSNAGNSRELEHCITNQFRPDDAETWVSATFAWQQGDADQEEIILRRVLKEDYGTTSTSHCTSVLFLGDDELDSDAEHRILDNLFAGVAPLLMQHTLRDFVQGDPKRRRDYFERLLRLDGLTTVISQAVITDERAVDFPSPNGKRHLDLFNEVGSDLKTEAAKKVHQKVLQGDKDITMERVTEDLSSICKSEYTTNLEGKSSKDEIVAALENEQLSVRQNSFPLLAQLRPRRELPDASPKTGGVPDVSDLVSGIRDAWQKYEPASLAVQAIGQDNLAILKAIQILLDAELIEVGPDSQQCPLCSYQPVNTLAADRVATISNWNPVLQTEQVARTEMTDAMLSLKNVIRERIVGYRELLPTPPNESDWEEALGEADIRLREVVERLRTLVESRSDLELQVMTANTLATGTTTLPENLQQCETFISDCVGLLSSLEGIPEAAKEYREAFLMVETAVGAEARLDPDYRLRERLITCFANAEAIFEAVKWEAAKRQTQSDLQQIRQSLITYRQQFLESRAESFNRNINAVWNALRKEAFATFNQLYIPRPRGRGFPIEIELKASLNDGNDLVVVDALKVFSESQVNALGIAAFVTRAKLLGHQLLVLDDPVQSMDEDHFKTFARDLIPDILDDGFQLVLLTHNDTFARDVSFYHHDRLDYVTMSMRYSRRMGAVVEQGNRRVHERLKLAERQLDEGNLERAWTYIRLAIERLYTVAYIKYGPEGFEATTWQHQTAEYMWESGAREVILSKLPDSGMRLKEILDMTAGGTHDKAVSGETDARASLELLRASLQGLRIGG